MQQVGEIEDASAEREARWDRIQALSLLLPAFLLAWPGPGSMLRTDFLPQATGAGAAAIALLPAVAILALRRPQARVAFLLLFLAPIAIGVAWITFGELHDTFEARRWLVGICTSTAALVCGASLGSAGRRVLARGLVCLALLLLGFALLDASNGFAGALGNTGSIAEAAIGGAAIGAAFLLHGPRLWRALGGLALVLFLVFVARAPVIAGGLGLAGALGLSAAARTGLPGRSRAVLGTLAAVALIAALGGAFLPRASARPSSDPAPAHASVGGFEVRWRIWRSSLALLGAHPWVGVGPGQFAARFPPCRDPQEIELSTHGRRQDVEREVEHPHSDVLLPILESGVVAGLAWLAFLAAVGIAGLRALRADDPERAAIAAGAFGIGAEALVNAPLSGDAAASTLAFALFGVLLARPLVVPAGRAARGLRIALFAILLACLPSALAFVRHGLALQPLARPVEIDADDAGRAVSAALDRCSDSPLALALWARLREERWKDSGVSEGAWVRVLLRRPNNVEGLMQCGYSLAMSGNRNAARNRYRRALEIDPGHPGILRNLMTLEFEEGNVGAGLRYLDRLAAHPPDRAWLEGLANRLFLRGLDREAEALLQRVDPALADLSAESCWARAKDEREAKHGAAADALECRAQRAWAREHASAGRAADAVRSYRQCLRRTLDAIPGGAPRVRLELAAALLLDGREDEARTQIEGLSPSPADWNALPAWAAERLRASTWFGG
jgi:O-antigen ligase/tetratricopeptide (TPR) repeat protein